jgi:multiple sugar transport system ATP-binding protein
LRSGSLRDLRFEAIELGGDLVGEVVFAGAFVAVPRPGVIRGTRARMAPVTFASVGKVYGDGTRAVREFDLEVSDGEFVVLVGPSGCGKTTALRMVAGLEEVSEGEIRIGDRVVNDLDPPARDVAMVFQNYALYPHMTVYDNIAFGLRMRKTARADVKRRVDEIGRVLGLNEFMNRKPRQLSGGQRQRVAMGRAIVRNPQVFLMDEPLSNLDARLRVQMRAEIARIQREVGATTIYVTHDQVEAMTMGDRVVVMRRGELQQSGEPQDVYERPVNLFVASFIGSPPMNLVQARLERRNGAIIAHLGAQELALPAELAASRPALASYDGATVGLGIRPEHLREGTPESDPGASVVGTVAVSEALGSEQLVHVDFEAEPVVTPEVQEIARDVDAAALDELRLEARERRSTLLARFESDRRLRAGDAVAMDVSRAKLHFFDLDTGRTIYD